MGFEKAKRRETGVSSQVRCFFLRCYRKPVYCDRCKHPAARGSQTELLVEGWPGPPQSRRESIDLCAPCSSALAAWLSVPALNHAPLRAARSAAAGA